MDNCGTHKTPTIRNSIQHGQRRLRRSTPRCDALSQLREVRIASKRMVRRAREGLQYQITCFVTTKSEQLRGCLKGLREIKHVARPAAAHGRDGVQPLVRLHPERVADGVEHLFDQRAVRFIGAVQRHDAGDARPHQCRQIRHHTHDPACLAATCCRRWLRRARPGARRSPTARRTAGTHRARQLKLVPQRRSAVCPVKPMQLLRCTAQARSGSCCEPASGPSPVPRYRGLPWLTAWQNWRRPTYRSHSWPPTAGHCRETHDASPVAPTVRSRHGCWRRNAPTWPPVRS